MLKIIEITTLIVSIMLAALSVKRIKESSAYVIHIIICFTCVLPLLFDYLIGKPLYSVSYPVFIDSYDDVLIRYLYCIYLLVTQTIVMNYGKKRTRRYTVSAIIYNDERDADFFQGKLIRNIMIVSAILIPFLVVLFGIPIKYLFSWSWRYDSFDTSILMGYSSIERISYIGIVASTILLFSKLTNLGLKILSLLMLYMNICIEGKRSALFFGIFAMVICYVYMSDKKLKILPLSIIAIISSIIIINLTIGIQSTYRGYMDFNGLYRMLRVDLFRDNTIKAAMYSMIYPDRIEILSYPFQSMIMQVGFLFPFVFMGVPRIGYETYMTAALKYISVNQIPNDVRMTVSYHDCSIANFGYLGFVIGGIISVYFAKLADNSNRYWKPVILSGYMLYSMYSFAYVCWYFEFWLIVYLFSKRRFKIHNRKGSKN